MSGFYLALALIIIVFRKRLIFNPVRKLFGNVMFGDDEDHTTYEEAFRSTETLNLRLRKMKKTIRKKEEKLGKKYDSLNEKLTINNIIQIVFRNAYESFLTTSNIARAAFSLVKRFSKKKKRKVRKSDRQSPPELEEGAH